MAIAVYIAGASEADVRRALGVGEGAGALGFSLAFSKNPGGPLAADPEAYPTLLTATPDWPLDDETAEDSIAELLARKIASSLGTKAAFFLPGPYQEVENGSVVSFAPDGTRTVEARGWKSGMR